MSDNFEQDISQRMDGFKLTPGPQVWEQVEAALPEKRRRRIAIWWWLPLAACLGGGVWLMINKQTGTGKIITDTTEKPSAEHTGTGEKLLKQTPADSAGNDAAINQQTASILKNNISNKPTNKINKEAIINKKENKTNSYSDKNTVALERVTASSKRKITNAETDENNAKKQPRVNDEPLENVAVKLNSATGNVRLPIPVNNEVFLNKAPVVPLADSAISQLATVVKEQDTTAIQRADTLLETTAKIQIPQRKKNNKSAWSLLVAVGRSSLNNDNGNQLESAFRTNYSAGGPIINLNGPGNGQIRTTGVFSNPKAGLNVSAGIARSQTISKHVSWQAAISYQLFTTTQRIGRRNDSLMQKDAGTSAAFFIGNTASYTNKVHRIQTASGIGYTINPSARTPICFSAGAFIAYNISNNLLLHDYRYYSYIRSSELSNKLMWGGEAGLDIFINHTIKAGLFYQHDFTRAGKPKVGSVFRWNQVQLRVGIPLSKH